MPRCTAARGSACSTLLYAPAGVPWVEELMAEVARRSGLQLGVDVAPLAAASRLPRTAVCLCDSGDPLCAAWTVLSAAEARARAARCA